VALEGVDGSGKSTQAEILAESLGAVLTFEPGATWLGRALRRLLLDPAPGTTDPAPGTTDPAPGTTDLDLDVRAEALLMCADRAQHVARAVAPALGAGRLVVTDRFSGSTLAYQGYGRGLPVTELRQLTAWASAGVEADLTVVVDVPLGVARQRLARAAPDRLERLDEGFFSRVRDGYLELAAEDPVHWTVVDGTGEVEAVATAVREAVDRQLGIASSGQPGGRCR
jgi:dTMP kinase